MKGRITQYNSKFLTGSITGENKEKYFFHKNDFNRHKIKTDYIVEFDIVDEGKDHLKAVNIKLIGLGKNHPYCNDIERVIDFINLEHKNNEEAQYRLRDLKNIYKYFRNLETTNTEA